MSVQSYIVPSSCVQTQSCDHNSPFSSSLGPRKMAQEWLTCCILSIMHIGLSCLKLETEKVDVGHREGHIGRQPGYITAPHKKKQTNKHCTCSVP